MLHLDPLLTAVRGMEGRYKKIRIKKNSGGIRIIHAPDEELKAAQRRWLENEYRSGTGPGPYAFGFVMGKGIKDHASAHVGRAYVVRIDIKDFFPSVTPDMLKDAWRFDGLLSKEIESRLTPIPPGVQIKNAQAPMGLAQLAFIPSSKDLFTMSLPQGSPLSPYLANIAMKRVDFRIARMLRYYGPPDARYTRYADDIIISSNSKAIIPMARPIRALLKKYGFEENRKKFRVMRASGRQSVCGIVVNKHPNLPKEKRRLYRAALHRILMMAIDGEDKDGKEVDWRELEKEFERVRGYFSFARNVAPDFYKKYESKIGAVQTILMARKGHK